MWRSAFRCTYQQLCASLVFSSPISQLQCQYWIVVWISISGLSSKNSGGTSSSMGAGSPSPIHTNTNPFSVRVGNLRAFNRPTIRESGPSVMNSTHSPLPSKVAPW